MTIEDRIKQKIAENLAPEHFELINESHRHAGHAGDDGSGQTHFKLIVVYSGFEECSRMQRHRMVLSHVNKLFSEGLHALSIEAHTPAEYF